MRTHPPCTTPVQTSATDTKLDAHPQALSFPETCPNLSWSKTEMTCYSAVGRLFTDSSMPHGWVFTILNYAWWSIDPRWQGHLRQSMEAGSGDTCPLVWTTAHTLSLTSTSCSSVCPSCSYLYSFKLLWFTCFWLLFSVIFVSTFELVSLDSVGLRAGGCSTAVTDEEPQHVL